MIPFKLLSIALFLIGLQICAYGQSYLSIEPAIGFSLPCSYEKFAPVNDSGFKANASFKVPSFSIRLVLNTNIKWDYFIGWHVADDTGFGIRYGDKVAHGFEGKLSVGSHTSRGIIGFRRHLLECRLFNLGRRSTRPHDDNDLLYLILFKLRLTGGMSYNYIVRSHDENNIQFFSYGEFTADVVNRNNGSVFVGANFQFFNYKKKGLQISIIYNKAFKEALNAHIKYTLAGNDYYANVASRGSYLALELAYPITLIKFKKQKTTSISDE